MRRPESWPATSLLRRQPLERGVVSVQSCTAATQTPAGPLGGFLDSAGGINGIAAGPQRDAALEATQKSAAQALLSLALALALALAASVAGAVPGSKLWPRRQHGDDLASNRVHGS